MFSKGTTTNDDAPIQRDEYETLLQDQLTELRPLRRRPPMMRPRVVTLKIVPSEAAQPLSNVVKLSS